MSHNEEHTRCQLIGACSSSAQFAMDAAATAIGLSAGQDSEVEVEVFSGTRAPERITAGERDQQARVVLSSIRRELDHLTRLYPCGGQVRVPLAPLADLDAAAGGG